LDRILAGATFVQAYTGFVYGGPLGPRRMNRGLARMVAEAGATSVQDLVGARIGDEPGVISRGERGLSTATPG
jgi:dihydroorotate dehydrogenase